jgi:ketosteroid isomerase-like protein
MGYSAPMSPENVEIVRRAIDAFDQRDLDAALREVDPEVEVDWSRSAGLEAGIYRGYQAVRGFWSTFLEMFDQISTTADELIESGEHVLVALRSRGQGRGGIVVEAKSVSVVTVREGRIVQWRLYAERAEALKAMGLEE